jgi:hypothetical protein
MDTHQQMRGWGRLVRARDGGCYAGNRIVVADRGRMVAVNVGGIVVAVAISGSGSGGGVGDVNARVLA